ncbi:MAG: outer membrane beta-barrel protein, partial [Bacteroidaceae bacterium]
SDNITAKGSLQVNRRLNNKGRNITLRVNYGYNDGETDKYSYSDTYYYLAQKDSIRNQYVDNWSNGYNYKVQMSYTEPIFTNRFLQFRYSYQYKRSRSEKYTYNWDKELEEYSHLPDTASSNCYRNEYSNQQANISLRTVREKYYYNIGMSIEPQKSTSVTYVGDSIKNTLSRHVINYAPLFDFRYRFSKQSQLRIMYRGRSSQPSMTDMQPVTDNSNPLNIKVGNPSLKPSYDNMVTLFYNSYMTKTQRGLTLHASFNNTM